MEFCLSEKVGTLANWIDGRRTINFQQECIPVGCVPSAAITISGGVCLGAQGRGGMCVSQQSTGQTPPPPPLWTEFLTHACENITFPQLLLRTVKIVKDSEVGWGTRPLKLLHHCCLWVQKVQINSFPQRRVWVSRTPYGIPTTEPAFIEWQSTICRFLPSPKILGE